MKEGYFELRICVIFYCLSLIPHKRAFQKEELTMSKARVSYMTGKQSFPDGCMIRKHARTVMA